MIYTVNGEEVEYIEMDTSKNKIDIKVYKKFDIVTADVSRITMKLQEKQIYTTICKDLYNGYICIFLEHVEDYIGILHILEVPMNAFELKQEDKMLVIYIDKIPKYQNKNYHEILNKIKNN